MLYHRVNACSGGDFSSLVNFSLIFVLVVFFQFVSFKLQWWHVEPFM